MAHGERNRFERESAKMALEFAEDRIRDAQTSLQVAGNQSGRCGLTCREINRAIELLEEAKAMLEKDGLR